MDFGDNQNNLDSQGHLTTDEDDYLLIRSFNNGEEAAFGKLIVKHKEKVRNLVYLTLGDTEYIDDISQDVFINVYHKLSEFRFESKFTTWLYRITINKCRDYLRKKRVRSIFVPIKEEGPEFSGGTHSENIDLPRLVRNAIEKLPEKLRIPLILRDIDGFSYNEIAKQLECEVGTVKSRIFRARESLKLILAPYQKELL
ncbi:MAG: RNA polymerase subunit sigma-70 [Ignavibacteria bacterium RBG_13_36_8]|nr:MAG: RNA polymerase subunit sigma-70 [Ignavibacteria bacterium RBG_13_36_8]